MYDLISRQDALDAFANYIHNVDKVFSTGMMSADDCKDAAHSVIDDLPSAQSQWIPCGVRMPDPDTWVLVSCDEDVTIMAVTEYGEWYFTNGDFTHGEIKAWMFLPEPWKEES